MTPQIDKRTAGDIAAYLYSRGVPQTGAGRALAEIFSRFTEIAIARLNQAPDKNLLAFLDLQGASLEPPEAARVPLTFTLANGAAGGALVKAGTQASAAARESEKDPTVFETERDLIVSPARLTAAMVRDARRDMWSNITAALSPENTSELPSFQGHEPIGHFLYFSLRGLLSLSNIQTLTLNMSCEPPSLPDSWQLQFEVWNGVTGVPVGVPVSGSSFTTTLQNVPAAPLTVVNGIESNWLRARLVTPITGSPTPIPGMIRGAALPRLTGMDVSIQSTWTDAPIAAVFFNDKPLDISKDFLPLGDRPKLGDVFLLASEAFQYAGTSIALAFAPSEKLVYTPATVHWEYWDGAAWAGIGDTFSTMDVTNSFLPYSDTSRAFCQAGSLKFKFATPPARKTVNGVTSFWVRGRLSAGDYGRDAQYVLKNSVDPGQGYTVIPATLHAPSVQSIKITSNIQVSSVPDAIVSSNDGVEQTVTLPSATFMAAADTSLSLGFESSAATIPTRKMTIYCEVSAPEYGTAPDNPAATSNPALEWEYWNGQWASLPVRDETNSFRESGLVEFLPPPDLLPSRQFGTVCFWVRARWTAGDFKFEPRIRHLFLNTTWASQTLTITSESIASSAGKANLICVTARKPVLPGQTLEVREPDLPGTAETAAIEAWEGADAITLRGSEVWVRWHEVPDFNGSGSRDRHYVLNRITGEVTFGDGQNGYIPPAGSNSIRMAAYRTGGGERGNRETGEISQLKTTVPYIKSVFNAAPAVGGAEAESLERLTARAPRAIRHGGRAVTPADYEDLALNASASVARALCVPLRDLELDATTPVLGMVSLIVVPRTTDEQPKPSLALLDLVRAYIERYSISTAALRVIGAPFVSVEVDAQIGVLSLDSAGEAQAACADALASYLNPLTGGASGTGWPFGMQPERSSLIALLAAVPGVDHVRGLHIQLQEKPAGALASGIFLVYSGMHKISVVYGGI